MFKQTIFKKAGKTKIWLGVLSLALLLGTTACNGRLKVNLPGNSASDSKEVTEDLEDTEETDTDQEITTLNDFLKTRTSIWYAARQDKGVGKDVNVDGFYVFQDGKVSVFFSEQDHTFGEVSIMTDEEIIQMLKNEDIERANTWYQNYTENFESTIQKSDANPDDWIQIFDDNGTDITWDMGKPVFVKIFESFKNHKVHGTVPGDFIMNVDTDETGNNQKSLTICLNSYKDEDYFPWSDWREIVYRYADKPLRDFPEKAMGKRDEWSDLAYESGNFQVYDSTYTGFASAEHNHIYVTRAVNNCQIVLNEPGDEGTLLDASRDDMADKLGILFSSDGDQYFEFLENGTH